MRSILVVSALSALAAAQKITGERGDAEVITNNPIGAEYVANLPERKTTSVRGFVRAVSNPTGTGVDFTVSVFGFPAEGGPFMYHIHDAPVPEDGNCTATLAHHDPYIRGEATICDTSALETCQVGDLSGKYGDVTGEELTQQYTDLYATLVPGLGSFFGNRSIVFHYANKTRITCANFEAVNLGEEVARTRTSATTVAILTTAPAGNATSTRVRVGINATSTSTIVGTGVPTSTRAPQTPLPPVPGEVPDMAGMGMWISSGAVLAAIAALFLGY